ncbi:MAG: nucleotidyltransferase domain-containing protein [Armatimonadetes bacterium]|nr:nucleotidyltransferase domain-containing protein [Armatimonadota bacterium]
MPSPMEMEVARQVKRRSQELLGDVVREVRLFGSRARGEAHPESDLDLLVLTTLDRPEVREQVHQAAADVLMELAYPYHVVPHVMTQDRFQELLGLEKRFALDVEHEGVLI